VASLVEDAQWRADRAATALSQIGYAADFSLESLCEINCFFDERSRDGQVVPGGLLTEQLGPCIFGLEADVGETIIRHHGGQRRGDDARPEGKINIQVVLPFGVRQPGHGGIRYGDERF